MVCDAQDLDGVFDAEDGLLIETLCEQSTGLSEFGQRMDAVDSCVFKQQKGEGEIKNDRSLEGC